jgi:hypothetical protein
MRAEWEVYYAGVANFKTGQGAVVTSSGALSASESAVFDRLRLLRRRRVRVEPFSSAAGASAASTSAEPCTSA